MLRPAALDTHVAIIPTQAKDSHGMCGGGSLEADEPQPAYTMFTNLFLASVSPWT